MLTAAVVGAGMGGSLSLAALQASSCYNLKAVADIGTEALAKALRRYPDLQAFSNAEAMLEEIPTDIVCISTPPALHEIGVNLALNLPLKGILVEKPLGHDHVSGTTVLHSIRNRNLPIAVPHGLLVQPTPVQVKRHILEGDIGELSLIEIQCSGWDIINSGIHWLDFCLHAVPYLEVQHVMSFCDPHTRTFRDGMQVETEAITYVQFESGLRIIMQTGDYVDVAKEGAGTLMRFVGSRGQIEFWPWSEGYRLQNGTHPQGSYLQPSFKEERSGHQVHLEHLAAQVESGSPNYEIAEVSLAALAICEAAYLSSRNCCKVTLPLSQFTPPPPVDWNPGSPYSGHGGGRDGRQLP